ncbi:MAG: VOC family protein [Actinobacteria bacterium]|nr:VOC family protein [Actinomycetota bacterium]
MIYRVGRVVVLVRDYDEAVEFYAQLGFQRLFDGRGDNGFRFVHIGLPDQSGVGLWLLQPADEEQIALIGRQTGGQPLMVLYTDDLHGEYLRLASLGVTFREDPREEQDSYVAHFRDVYGNEIVLVQVKDGDAAGVPSLP